VDALGNPVYFQLSEGQEADSKYASKVLDEIEIRDSNILGDKGYDSDAILEYVKSRGGKPTIPPKANRKEQRECDWYLYKERHLVECFFNKLKNFRHIATRYDKLATVFAGFTCLACIVILIK
jgi:transposase